MSALLSTEHYEQMLRARALLESVQFVGDPPVRADEQPPIQSALLASTLGVVIQALMTGSCWQMVSSRWQKR